MLTALSCFSDRWLPANVVGSHMLASDAVQHHRVDAMLVRRIRR